MNLGQAVSGKDAARVRPLVEIDQHGYAVLRQLPQRPVAARVAAGRRALVAQPGDTPEPGVHPELAREPGDRAEQGHTCARPLGPRLWTIAATCRLIATRGGRPANPGWARVP